MRTNVIGFDLYDARGEISKYSHLTILYEVYEEDEHGVIRVKTIRGQPLYAKDHPEYLDLIRIACIALYEPAKKAEEKDKKWLSSLKSNKRTSSKKS